MPPEQPEQRSDPRQWLRYVWRHRWALVAIVVLIPAAVYGISMLLPKTYESTTSLRAEQGGIGAGFLAGQLPIAVPSNEGTVELVETTPVSRRAAQELGEPPTRTDALLQDVTAEMQPTESGRRTTSTAFFTISARADTPERAAEVANAFAVALSDVRAQQGVQVVEETIETLLAEGNPAEGAEGPGTEASQREFARQLQQLRALQASQANTTQILEQASPPPGPVSPKPLRNAGIGSVLALLIAGALIPIMRALDRRLHQARDAEELTGAPLLAQIPESAFPGHPPDAHAKEAFQTLRANLTYFNVDHSLGSLVVCSPGPGDGKTTVAMNLAIALAEAGSDVVLVDADLRRAPLARRLGADSPHGLDAVLLNESGVEQALVEISEVEGGRLRLLGGGSSAPNPSVLLNSDRMRSVLAELSEIADLVIVDTPALLAVSDAVPLLPQVSGAIVVGCIDRTTRESLRRTCEVIESTRGKTLGVVITGTKASRFSGYEYGYYGYGYGYGDGVPDGDREGAGNGRRPVTRRVLAALRIPGQRSKAKAPDE